MQSAIDIRIPLDRGRSLAGAVAMPVGEGPHPGVIVLSEIWGLTPDIRHACQRFAAAGYAALAPSLYSHGPRALCVARVLADTARGARSATLDDIAAARAHLVGLPGVDGDRTAIIGFCQGGGFALSYAAERGGMQAASVNYGAVPKERGDLATVCPVVASYGGLDKVMRKEGERLGRFLDELGVPNDTKVYEGAGHGFLNDNGGLLGRLEQLPSPLKVGFRPAEADDAWQRIFAFFGQHV